MASPPPAVNTWFDVWDTYDHGWYEAQVRVVIGNIVTFKFKSYGDQWNVDIVINSDDWNTNVSPIGTHTTPSLDVTVPDNYEFKINEVLVIRDPYDDDCFATVIGIDHENSLVKFHYNGWDSRHDEWLPQNSYRIRFVDNPNPTSSTDPVEQIVNDWVLPDDFEMINDS